jgi:anti-sigma factor RsiW
MSNQEPNRWPELGLRRPLTPEQERWVTAHLAAHPAEAAAREEDLCLNRLLRQLPEAPLASNFTARVLTAVEGERPRRVVRRLPRSWAWLGDVGWGRPVTLALVAGAVVLGGYRRYQSQVRVDLAHSVAAVSTVATVPTLEMLEHFDAINRLSQAPPIQDKDLLPVPR